MKVVLAHGFLGLFDFFPLLFIGAAIWVILKVLRDGQHHASKTPKLPTTPWSRQVATATRKRGGSKPASPSAERPAQPRRLRAPHLRVMDGEAADESRPAVPRRFEPPPPGRRKTG
jgi:hypothetical protein